MRVSGVGRDVLGDAAYVEEQAHAGARPVRREQYHEEHHRRNELHSLHSVQG